MIRSFSLRALGAAAFLLTSSAAAYAAVPETQPSTPPEIGHVVTSDRSDESIDKTSRTTFVVTKDTMRVKGYHTVAEALASVPGANVQTYNPGALAQIGLRGSSSAQVLVLVDGMAVAGRSLLDVNLNDYSTAGVDRIEVIEGGGSTLYGSGSIGGVINIITARPTSSQVQLRAGSFGERSVRVETPYVSFERSVGDYSYALPNGTSRVNADSALTSLHAGYDKTLGKIDANIALNINARHLGVPGGDSFLSTTSREHDLARTLTLSLSRKTVNATTTLDLGGASFQNTFTCLTSDPGCFNLNDQFLTDGLARLSVRNVVRSDRSMTLYGADLSRGSARIDDGAGDILYYPYAQTAVYAQQRWADTRNDSISVGLRGERDGGTGGSLSPAIGAVARLSRDVTLKANAATAFRAPTVEDLYYPGFANPALVPEHTRVGDISILDNAIGGGASLGWFYTSGRNLIVLDNNFKPQNIGHASIAGLTFTAKSKPLHSIVASLDLTNLYKAQDTTTNTRISGRGPVVSATLALDYTAAVNAFVANGGISMRTESARDAVNFTQPLFDQAAAYSRLNAYIGLRTGRSTLVTVRGFNLGNERYAEISGYPMPGRSFAIELSTK